MKVIETDIPDVKIIEPKVFGDHRGWFLESYNKNLYKAHGIDVDFVQDNRSFSKKGILRGLHYQLAPYSQSKLVSVLSGEVLDIAVDIRKGSPTYGEHVSVILSAENKRQLFVPQGFAHGFIVLSETAEFFYKVDNYYTPSHDRGIMYNDPKIGIDWMLSDNEVILSEKDTKHPQIDDADNNFEYGKI